ncbi:hypothetical protein HDU81_007496 [Chytriomyces hyalinus]|nr:hypothetical protein HDU81_007496 [Chytriomyces hyalinus]
MNGSGSDPHLLRVVDDVERYVLLEARRKADSELHSRVEDSMGTVQRDVEKRKRIPSMNSVDMPPAKTNTRIQFNLKASSSSPISSLLQVQPTDTPHTRALKIRQQRLIAAKNESLGRVESVSAIVRKSMKTVTNAQKSIRKTALPAKTRLDGGSSSSGIFNKITSYHRTRSNDLWMHHRFNNVENGGENETHRSDPAGSEGDHEESEYDSDLADIESFLNKSADDDHISNESFPSDFEPGQTVSEGSFGYDHPTAHTVHEVSDSEEVFDEHGRTEMSMKEGSSGFPDVALGNEQVSTIAERNFKEFEGIIKSQLGIKTIPKATKNVVWSGQLRDRRKQLDSRLHARKRNMHKEISTFSDVRPIQVLRKETEKEAFMKQSKREREAQRRAKIAVSEQKRRVVRMENRVSEVEGQVQSVTQKRQMREAQLARSLYDSYLSSQREIVREALRSDLEQKGKIAEAEKMKREAKEAHVRDQIRLLEEELKASKREEEIVAKAHAEEMRKLIREQKEAALKQVKRIRDKLTLDENDFELQKAAADNIARQMRFVLKSVK